VCACSGGGKVFELPGECRGQRASERAHVEPTLNETKAKVKMELCEPSSLRVALSVAGAHKRASLGSQTALNLTHRPFPLSLSATSKKAHTRERERESENPQIYVPC